MIRRYYEASLKKDNRIVQWGTGKPERDFVYAGDVAATIPYFVESFDDTGPINISSENRTSIKELAETIAKLTGFSGEIAWDLDKPDGQLVKIFDTTLLRGLGLSCETALDVGLRKTIDWFASNYSGVSDGLRL